MRPSRWGSGVSASDGLDVGRLLTLRALRHLEGYFLAFFERFEPAHLNGGEVRKEIFAPVIRRNEAIAFCVVEPFNRTSCHTSSSATKKRAPARICLASRVAYGDVPCQRNPAAKHPIAF